MSREPRVVVEGDPLLTWNPVKSVANGKNPIVETGRFSGIYSLDDLTSHFKIFADVLSKNEGLTAPIFFSLQNDNHKIENFADVLVTFDPSEKKWLFEEGASTNTNEQIAEKVKDKLADSRDDTSAFISTTLYTSKNQHDFLTNSFEEIEANQQWQKIHEEKPKSAKEQELTILKGQILDILREGNTITEKLKNPFKFFTIAEQKEKLIGDIINSKSQEDINRHIIAYKPGNEESRQLEACKKLLQENGPGTALK